MLGEELTIFNEFPNERILSISDVFGFEEVIEAFLVLFGEEEAKRVFAFLFFSFATFLLLLVISGVDGNGAGVGVVVALTLRTTGVGRRRSGFGEIGSRVGRREDPASFSLDTSRNIVEKVVGVVCTNVVKRAHFFDEVELTGVGFAGDVGDFNEVVGVTGSVDGGANSEFIGHTLALHDLEVEREREGSPKFVGRKSGSIARMRVDETNNVLDLGTCKSDGGVSDDSDDGEDERMVGSFTIEVTLSGSDDVRNNGRRSISSGTELAERIGGGGRTRDAGNTLAESCFELRDESGLGVKSGGAGNDNADNTIEDGDGNVLTKKFGTGEFVTNTAGTIAITREFQDNEEKIERETTRADLEVSVCITIVDHVGIALFSEAGQRGHDEGVGLVRGRTVLFFIEGGPLTSFGSGEQVGRKEQDGAKNKTGSELGIGHEGAGFCAGVEGGRHRGRLLGGKERWTAERHFLTCF